MIPLNSLFFTTSGFNLLTPGSFYYHNTIGGNPRAYKTGKRITDFNIYRYSIESQVHTFNFHCGKYQLVKTSEGYLPIEKCYKEKIPLEFCRKNNIYVTNKHYALSKKMNYNIFFEKSIANTIGEYWSVYPNNQTVPFINQNLNKIIMEEMDFSRFKNVNRNIRQLPLLFLSQSPYCFVLGFLEGFLRRFFDPVLNYQDKTFIYRYRFPNPALMYQVIYLFNLLSIFPFTFYSKLNIIHFDGVDSEKLFKYKFHTLGSFFTNLGSNPKSSIPEGTMTVSRINKYKIYCSGVCLYSPISVNYLGVQL